jgi:hypothetical protein
MQIKETLVRLALVIFPFYVTAQTTYLPQGAEENIIIERMEIKAQKDSVLNFSKIRPFSREAIVTTIRIYHHKLGGKWMNGGDVSKIDLYNMHRFAVNNPEWVFVGSEEEAAIESKKPFWKSFYKTQGTLYEVHQKDFDLAINPVLQFQFSKENNNSQTLFLNTRGVRVRGRIANKIGFDTYLTDNQERDPLYVQGWENKFKSVPGEGYYKNFKTTGYDYFDARGYFTFGVTKYIDVAFGYDKNFIGNGYRSLFLSDFSNNTLFLKLNTRIWRFNYQNLFMELVATEPRAADRLLRKKYAVMHHLDVGITRSVNIGLFEGVIFGRPSHFEFGYLNPIIFYRSIEQQSGSFDNSVAGLDVKANVKHTVQLYGQFLLDEFVLSEIKKHRGFWGNKWGVQAGAKYIDAFGIKNLDLQLETNVVRPFTYSHNDSIANYTHYNQPLAHPLGANFYEWIGIARYQPAARWLLQGKLFYWKQGIDSSATESWGSNIFLANTIPPRQSEFGYHIGDGLNVKGFIASFLLSYELKQNLFIDVSAFFRKYDVPDRPSLTTKTTVFSIGVRLNMNRREFEF